MSGNVKSNWTRRGVLAAAGGLSVWGTALDATVSADEPDTQAPQSLEKIQNEYQRLLPLWQKEREQFRFSSNTADYWKGPHGKSLIALGPAIIPQLIRELRAGDFFFNIPLETITKFDVTNGKSLSEQDKSRQWIAWWENGSAK
jgi:hypothetical protein